MTFAEIVALHKTLSELNPDELLPDLRDIGIRRPTGTRRVRKKTQAYHRNLTPEMVVARLDKECRRRTPGPMIVPLHQYQWGVGDHITSITTSTT